MYVTESLGCTEEISNIANQLQFKIFFLICRLLKEELIYFKTARLKPRETV